MSRLGGDKKFIIRRSMKICLINNLYKPYAKGGAERIVELQAEGLIKAGYEVFIISTKPLFKSQKSKVKSQKLYYLPGLYYNLNKIPKILRLPWHLLDIFDVGNYFRIKSILKKKKPDVVITHNLKGLSYLIPNVIKCLKIKHIHVLHDAQLLHPSGLILCGREKQLKSFPAKLYISLCRWLFNSPEIVISPSKWLIKLHEEKNFFSHSEKIILPNPIPDILIPSIHPTPHPLTPSPKQEMGKTTGSLSYLGEGRGDVFLNERGVNEVFRFLYVGQIEKHKGILFLIKSLSILCQNFSRCDFELVIAGTGSKLKKARQLAKTNQYIKLLGWKDKEEVKELMKSANCLIVPSLCYENSPTVIYEAAASGLPIIAARLGGIPELVHKLGGILFKAGNEGDLMHQMRWAMDNPEFLRKIGGKSGKKIKKFGLNYYLKELIANFQ